MFALSATTDGVATVDLVLKFLLEVPPSIVAPVPDITDNVPVTAYPLIVVQLSGGILTNLNPVTVMVSVTIIRLLVDIFVRIRFPVVAWRTPPTKYRLKFEYNLSSTGGTTGCDHTCRPLKNARVADAPLNVTFEADVNNISIYNNIQRTTDWRDSCI